MIMEIPAGMYGSLQVPVRQGDRDSGGVLISGLSQTLSCRSGNEYSAIFPQHLNHVNFPILLLQILSF